MALELMHPTIAKFSFFVLNRFRHGSWQAFKHTRRNVKSHAIATTRLLGNFNICIPMLGCSLPILLVRKI
jgi:hypothetical protein